MVEGGHAADPFPEYPKIQSLWKRDQAKKNQCIVGDWAVPEFEALADMRWLWTEKVDGTNIRLGWPGVNLSSNPNDQFRRNEHAYVFGRTDNAQIPPKLLAVLIDLQKRLPYEESFDGTVPVTLYGEGYGAGIQKGGQYRPDPAFVLFDVKVGPWWLSYENVCDVGAKMGVEVVPLRLEATLVSVWKKVGPSFGLASERWPGSTVEGLVGRPPVTLYNGKGERILAKVKVRDHPSHNDREAQP